MLLRILLGLVYLCGGLSSAVIDASQYWKDRNNLLADDFARMLGNDLTLNADEALVNDMLMQMKVEEIEFGFNESSFFPAESFFSAKSKIENSPTFQFIRDMPKGSVLHSHDMALTSIEWVVSELTYWNNLYMCYLPNDRMWFRFFTTPDETCVWKLVADERQLYINASTFDNTLRKQLSILTDDPEEYRNIDLVWQRFNNAFESIQGLTMYVEAWKSYLAQALQQFMEDNVTYLEFRGVLPNLYELDGSEYTSEQTIGTYVEVVQNFTAQNADRFYGARFIYAPFRGVDVQTAWQYVELAEQLRTLHPEFVAGFDLVGQEDKGRPLKTFIEPILDLQKRNVSIPVFFHAGETNWEGINSDENIFDAILMNSTRIGHGYAILKHPSLMQIARDNQIAVEICPISNQVLKLVDDLRNHPMASLVADSFPVVVSSDDPAMWDALPLSHDFYEAFMGLGGAKADLRFLKKLALNSITYSSLSLERKSEFQTLWQIQWDSFIQKYLQKTQNDPWTNTHQLYNHLPKLIIENNEIQQ